MADWDADSPQSAKNIEAILSGMRNDALARRAPTIQTARGWHQDMMHNLSVPQIEHADKHWVLVGKFRGEPGLENCEVAIGDYLGVPSGDVADELMAFESNLQAVVEELDGQIPPGHEINVDQLAAVIDLCAWAHSEWVRIHPFANGSARTARLWSNYIAMRHGLPLFVRLRPRPDYPYELITTAAMKGDWRPTAQVFLQMYRDAIRPEQ